MTPSYIIWDADPQIFGLPVRWYGLMFAIGFLLGYEIVCRMFKHEGAPERWVGILLLWCVAGTLVGARLGHVFFYEWDSYSQHPMEIFKVWKGGLASHGGAIGVILGVLCFSYFTTKRSPLWTFDRVVVPIALVGCMIRIGNLMNSEIFGTATDLPWGMWFVRSYEWQHTYPGIACHPTQIYEAICYLALFGLLMWMYWKRNAECRPGLIFGTFLAGTFLPRFFIEFIKNNQNEALEATMTLNIGQQLSIPFVIVGIFFIVRAMMRPARHIDFPNAFPDEPSSKKKK
ncbi:MAG: prolipoprotein diacylglyceryl transferase [Paramuribaculum sp.]|nr:prolipoprotein diacylglyceryl transferase [Paramuribaculum sp.]